MTRYTEKQKLAAVTAYRKGADGLRATASAHNVGVDSLRAWIAAYEANGKAGLVAKRRVIYDLDFKLEVLRRMQDEGLSCMQVAALFNIRRLDLVAEWSRLYAAHGAAALQPGWKWEQTRMSKPPSRHDDGEAVTNDQRSREELLRDLQQLRAENAYPLAFDHDEQLRVAVQALRSRVEADVLPLHLLPEKFTLTQLQRASEAILNRDLDKSAFRCRLKGAPDLIELGEYERGPQRPAQLFMAREGFRF